MVKDSVELYDPVNGKPESIPITKQLRVAVKSAYASYQSRLDQEKKKRKELAKQREKEKDEV